MSDVTVAGAQILALLALLAGVISWLFKLAYGAMKEDRDWWRESYRDKEKTEWKQVQVIVEGISTLHNLLSTTRKEES